MPGRCSIFRRDMDVAETHEAAGHEERSDIADVGDGASGTKRPVRFGRIRRWIRFGLTACVWGYTAGVVGLWLLFRLAGDRWWFATLLMFGPRWIYAVPLLGLVPAAIVMRRRWLLPLGVAVVIAVGPIMGFNVPWRTLGDDSQPDLRVVAYNIDRWNVKPERFARMLEDVKPDLVAIQECPTHRWNIPDGWDVRRAGELIVVSARPIVRHEVSRSRWPPGPRVINGMYCVVDTPAGRVGFACVSLDTPRRGLSAVLDRETILDLDQTGYAHKRIEWRRRESEDMARWLAGFPEPKILAGDFNMPTDSTIYREFWRGYSNAFDRAGFGLGYTKRTSIRRRSYGARIDHVLTDGRWRAVACRLGPGLGSDHRPVIADVVWVGGTEAAASRPVGSGGP